MTSQPSISILINNYNYGRFLREAIDSALNQTYSNTEVIVVDDGSTDDSRAIVQSYGSRIVAVLKSNGGQASAFNAGIAHSHGEWILFLDSDDRFAPCKAEIIATYAEQFPSAGVIAHNFDYCDETGAPATFQRPAISTVRLADDRKQARKGRLSVYLPPTSGLAVKSDVLAKIVPFPEDIVIATDNYLKFASLALTPVLMIPDRIATQRIHSQNAYTHGMQTEESRLKQALVSAQIAYRLVERFPELGRLGAKQYGRAMHELFFSHAVQARGIRRKINRDYAFLHLWPWYGLYAAGGFFRSMLGRPPRLQKARND